MFGLRKSRFKEPSTTDMINMLGYILQNRPKIISYADLAEDNIFAGSVIGRAFAEDRQRLDDEFNALAAFFACKAYMKFGASKEGVDRAMQNLFDEFLADDVFASRRERDEILNQLFARTTQYLQKREGVELALAVMRNIAVKPMTRHEENAADQLAKRLRSYEQSIADFIERDIEAAP